MTERIRLGSGLTTAVLLCCSALFFSLTSRALCAAGGKAVLSPSFFLTTITKWILLTSMPLNLLCCFIWFLLYLLHCYGFKQQGFPNPWIAGDGYDALILRCGFFSFVMHRARVTRSLELIVRPPTALSGGSSSSWGNAGWCSCSSMGK